jgi:hypothetical protein
VSAACWCVCAAADAAPLKIFKGVRLSIKSILKCRLEECFNRPAHPHALPPGSIVHSCCTRTRGVPNTARCLLGIPLRSVFGGFTNHQNAQCGAAVGAATCWWMGEHVRFRGCHMSVGAGLHAARCSCCLNYPVAAATTRSGSTVARLTSAECWHDKCCCCHATPCVRLGLYCRACAKLFCAVL